jgi:hypothetical protein
MNWPSSAAFLAIIWVGGKCKRIFKVEIESYRTRDDTHFVCWTRFARLRW